MRGHDFGLLALAHSISGVSQNVKGLGGLLRGPNRTLGHWASRRNTPEFGFFRFPILDEYEYRIARYGNVWTSDDSNKAWGMLFESSSEPFESNKISIFYLTRKGAGHPSDSNSIPHALFESSDMQAVP